METDLISRNGRYGRNNAISALWPATLSIAVSLSAMLASGCVVEWPNEEVWDEKCNTWCGDNGGMRALTPSSEVAVEVIDANETMSFRSGEGIGFFVEYSEGGRWRFALSCDTKISDRECRFFVNASFDETIDPTIVTSGLSNVEYVGSLRGNVTYMGTVGRTARDVVFDIAPGYPVVFTLLFDGRADSRYMFWVGDGVLHSGAPTNPLKLVPGSP